MWESRKGWTRFAMFALGVLTLTLGSCLRPAILTPIEDQPALSDSLSPEDEIFLLQGRYSQAEALARSGQEFAALDTLRNLFFDLRAPGGRTDSLRWALQLATTREMGRLLERTGPDPREGEGISSLDFKVQLLKDSLSDFGTGEEELLESALAEEQPDLETDSLLQEVVLEPDSLAIRRVAMPDIPDCDRPEVERMVDYFATGRGHRFFQIWLDRYPVVAPVMRRVLQEEGMPEDLIFLAMIESGLRIGATSRAKARGPWQFIPGTAQLFDLRVDYWMDERLDLERSTRAASRFLRKLYDRYDDWYLAMAAYNWGPGRIDRAVARGVTDYWSIGRMPSETRSYVPTYLAARRVFQDHDLYGFTLGAPVQPPDLGLLEVEGSIRLSRLADLFDIEEARLGELNHHLVQGSTPPDGGHLYVPAEVTELCRDRLQQLPQSAFQDWARHKVRRGETLAGIARRYGVSTNDLRHANKLSSRARLKTGRMLLVPLDAQQREERLAAADKPSSPDRASGVHRVRRGETLSGIARHYGLGVGELAAANGLSSRSKLKAGQRLRIPGAGDEDGLSAQPERSNRRDPSLHTVKRGETLTSIARRYDLGVGELAAANKLSAKARVRAGRKLRIPDRDAEGMALSAPPAETTAAQPRVEAVEKAKPDHRKSDHQAVILPKHKVRRGDVLDRIARKYGVSVGSLMAWNQLGRGDRIYPGQELLLADPDSVERLDPAQDADLARAAPPTPSRDASPGSKARTHVVRAGETAGAIAQRYDVSVRQLVDANGLGRRARIVTGQRLRIPGAAAGPQQVIHVVKSGESLWSLARQYKVEVADIRRWNNLRGSEIHAGSRLVIILAEEG